MLGFLLFHQLFWTEVLNYTKCLPPLPPFPPVQLLYGTGIT